MVPSEAVTYPPFPGRTVQYSPQLTLCSGQHPSSTTRPILTSSPPGLQSTASPDTGRDGGEDARLRRMEAAGPGTSWLQNWPQSRSNQRPD